MAPGVTWEDRREVCALGREGLSLKVVPGRAVNQSVHLAGRPAQPLTPFVVIGVDGNGP